MIKSLYVHIPFCIKKCLYCDFSSFANSDFLQDDYIDALIEEIRGIKESNFKTIFVGGGTPTILSLKNLNKLLCELKRFNPEEFTFESNPGTITNEKLRLLKEMGVNRISMGLQAWQNDLLKSLGRIHTIEDFLEGFEMCRNNGFNNINIDLMFGIPNQTPKDWRETLNNVINLRPEHISCYSLIIEEGTPFYDLYNEGKLKLPNEEDERVMYHDTMKLLSNSGYNHYEISNFALSGMECKHNITYWKDDEYIGVGTSAHSYVGGKRYSNISKIGEYINGVKESKQVERVDSVERKDEMSEYMFLGLRMLEGIDKNNFKQRFGVDINSIYANQINNLIKQGLLEEDGNFIRLSRVGIDLANKVFVEFI